MSIRPQVSLCLCLAVLVAACGDDGRADRKDRDLDPPGPGPDTTVEPPGTPTEPGPDPLPIEGVEERLAAIGVPLLGLDELGAALTDRTGRPLPDDSHPLQDPVATIEGAVELVVFGPGGGARVVDLDEDGLAGQPEHVVAQLAGAFEDWDDPQVVGLHADADGREETVAVDLRGGQDVFVWLAEDREDGFAQPYGYAGADVGDWPGASDLSVARFDLEGDGVEEVLMLARVGDGWELRTLSPIAGTVGPVLASGELVPTDLVGEVFQGFSLATGELDGDAVPEVAIAIDTRADAYAPLGSTRVVVLDVRAGAFAGVHDEVARRSDGRPIVAGGVAFADIDADFVDELVIGGAQRGVEVGRYRQHVIALEDLADAATAFSLVFEGELAGSLEDSDATFVAVDTQLSAGSSAPGLTGGGFDLAEDVLVNNVLWEFTTVGLEDPEDPAIALAPREVLELGRGTTQIELGRDVARFAFGQLDGDGMPDVAVYDATALFQGDDHALVPGELFVRSVVPGVDTVHEVALAPDLGFPARVALANVDPDSIVVQYLPEEHRIVYSEPVIVAAIAAPPCHAGPDGQNTDACLATLGSTSSNETNEEDAMSVSAGIHVGFSVADRVFTQSEFEATATVEATAATGFGAGSSLSFTRAYNVGAGENQILATVAAYEQFAYLVLDAPDGDDGTSLVGEVLIVSIPRGDATTTRLYSESLLRPSMRPSQQAVLDRVFAHALGDPATYPHPDDLGALMRDLGVSGGACDEQTSPDDMDRCGWLTHDDPLRTPVAAGPAINASESVVLEVGSSTEEWSSWGVTNTVDLEVTAGGVLFGASLSAGTESTMTVTHGDSVEYGLEIGAVDAAVHDPYSASIVAYKVQFDCVDDELGDEACDGFQVLGFTVE